MTRTKICQRCGQSFVPHQGPMRYCSPACRKTNAEKCREQHQRHRAKRLAKMREWYAANRDTRVAQMRAKWRQTRAVSPWKHIMDGAKHRAKTANLPFDLTNDWARTRWSGRCEVTDLPFQLGLSPSDKRMYAASIDRIDPKIGYIQSNCRFILFAVNCLRQNGTDEEMYAIAKAIVRTRLPLLQRR